MGFAEIVGGSGFSDKLDLVEYEKKFIKKFNDTDMLSTKYEAEEFGITFNKGKGQSDVYLFDGTEEITICPEPLGFIKEFDDVSDNTTEANRLFRNKISSFQKMKLNKIPELKDIDSSAQGERMWMNKTLNGINLRPGNLNDDRDKFDPIRMCDDNVHGLIVGRTGSGKSVFINALILSLITEYSPWELNLYLADFKKVELSRYMNNADESNGNTPYTPHINACAATSEIRYVISLIKYLVDCMNARQEFFARLGVTKIQEFRNTYNLVLPRVLMIVDEFQQLFTEATNREKEEIQTMLNSITKLGRATGFHLIFASQEMSGTLRGNTLANFKIRMALPCNQQISTDILGNSQAVNLERGYVLINTDSGNELENKKYRVPFIETDKKDDDDSEGKTAFYYYLDGIKKAAKLFDLRYKTDSQKFYREELQETESSYRKDLDSIREKKNALVAKNTALYDAVILGKSVLYSPKPNDKVSFYIERGRNKGIMIACPEPDSAARIRKLLAENLFRSDKETYHFGMEINNLILERYCIDKAVECYPNQKYYPCDIDKGVECLELIYYLRSLASKYMDTSADRMKDFREDERKLLQLLRDAEKVKDYEFYKERKESLASQIADIDKELSETNKELKKKIGSPAIEYFKKCSEELIVIPKDKTKAEFVNLKSYNEVAKKFNDNPDIAAASKESVEIIDKMIAALDKNITEPQTDAEKLKYQQQQVDVTRNKLFRAATLFFADKYEGKTPEKRKVTPYLEEIYASVVPLVDKYKKEREKKEEASKRTGKITDKKTKLQNKLNKMLEYPHIIESTEGKVLADLKQFADYIFDTAYSSVGYNKKNKPATPPVQYSLRNKGFVWTFKEDDLGKQLAIAANDILSVYIDACRTDKRDVAAFKKAVFWINGLDEIEKIPNQMVEVIRNAMNQNILVVGIITSELKDATTKKAFDYAFVTGNIEKFYSMFDIRYTKQPLDSIVVNFGIRSKGFDIPFKMYKSNLEEIQAPDFIDRLLNAEEDRMDLSTDGQNPSQNSKVFDSGLFGLGKDEAEQYITFYQKFLEKIQDLNKSVTDGLNETMQRTQYELLQKKISEIMVDYADVVYDIEKIVFPTWQESEESLRAYARAYGTGSGAEEACAQIENKLEKLLHAMLKMEKVDLVDTSYPDIRDEDFKQLENVWRTAQAKTHDIKEKYISQLSVKETDNGIYGTLRPLIEDIAAELETFYETSLKSFVELSRWFFAVRKI